MGETIMDKKTIDNIRITEYIFNSKVKIVKYISSFLLVFILVFEFNLSTFAENTEGMQQIKFSSINNKITLLKGSKKKIRVKLISKNVSRKKLIFLSSDKTVASVSKKGIIKAKKQGSAKIIIKLKNIPKKNYIITVIVKDKIIKSKLCENKIRKNKISTTKVIEESTTNSTNLKEPKIKISYPNQENVPIKPKKYIVMHRGYSDLAPENSLAAFNLAAETDCDAIECDVQETKDGKLVISHDNFLENMFGISANISDSNWDDIKDLTMINGNNIDIYPNEKLPTLEEYLSIVKKSNKIAFIEIKNTLTTEGLNNLKKIVNSYYMENKTYFLSFYENKLLYLKDLYQKNLENRPLPNFMFLAMSANTIVNSTNGLTATDYCIMNNLHLGVSTISDLESSTPIENLHLSNLLINIFSVNDENEAYNLLYNENIDMITCNSFYEI